LVITKMDRLMIELKLPPRDAYFKLLSVIESVSELVQKVSQGRYPKISPERGNVAFCSAEHGWLFTLESFAQVYLEHNLEECLGENLSAADFAKRLWGNVYLDPASKRFYASARECSSNTTVERTFVTYILEPLYKIYAACLGELEPNVDKLLRSVGVDLNKQQLRASAQPLLKSALSKFMQTANRGLVDMIVKCVPHPAASAKSKIARCYTGPLDTSHSPLVKAMMECDAHGPLVIHCTKLHPTPDGQSFSAFGRIYSGTVRAATDVTVLGEGYTPQDEEDSAAATVEGVSIPGGRVSNKVSVVKAGNWVLLHGIDASIAKTATIVGSDSLNNEQEMHIFAPLKFPQAGNESICKLAIEPLNPAELPKMVEGLRRISKAYPMAATKVEESGEHILLGTGELYLDCIMHDLRNVYSDIEIKVADPIVSFRETAVETSSIKCFAETTNKRNKLTFISEPLDDGLAETLEAGKVNPNWEKKKLGRFFQTQYNWDLLSSRSVWAFGDSPTHGTNILMDDTLPGEVDKQLLNSCKSSIVQGFQWATREGPLCEEPVRGTKIKILDATLADKPMYRGGGQIIPTTRRVVHSSLLTATPRLMEPIYRLQIQCPGSIVDSIQPLLYRRRGHIVQDRPISGSTFYSVKGFLPVLDSFGFETDLRTFTQGQAMVYSVFDHWAVVPGNPLDRSILLHPLEPSPQQHLARELLLKTRRRKGLSEDVTISKFFDDERMKVQLSRESEAPELLQ
jgi:U5 small nuclear ribonucleoprotein component